MAPITQDYTAENFFGALPDLLPPGIQRTDRPWFPEPQIEDPPETTSPDADQVKQQPVSKAPKKAKSDNVSNKKGLRFFVVAHPDQLKDKKQMRQNRQHVMHDYLDKEARNPDSKDSRVRKHSLRQANSEDAAIAITPPESSRSSDSSHELSDRECGRNHSKKIARVSSLNRAMAYTTNSRPGDTHYNERPLIQGLGGRFENSQYMKAAASEIPFSMATKNLGGDLNPFGTWPDFDDPNMGMNELKFSCSQRFGTYGLSVHWIPTLLRARHAFLSTLCISSSHDDIMRRNLLPPKERGTDHRLTASLMKRLQVRQEVISMINESLNDPDLRIADETIVAVLHVLNSEIMGCDDRSMRVHQLGLHEMVRERGGLEKLGINGQLASILTITMFLLGCLREIHPHQEFLKYASTRSAKVSEDICHVPESPVYCRPNGFQSISKVLSPHGDTWILLDTIRQLTNEFFLQNTQSSMTTARPSGPVRSSDQTNSTITNLRDSIFALEPAWEKDFDDMNDRYTYESLRLVALVYAHAICRRIPFSKAAAELGDLKIRPASAILPDDAMSVPIMLKNALMRTDTSYCWNHLAGVLFWATVIAGATANPGPFANEERECEEEDARKWITAIAVRCCIVLSFEYGSVVLETLKRVMAIQTVIAKADHEQVAEASSCARTTWTEIDLDRSTPATGSAPRGFSDFALDFMTI